MPSFSDTSKERLETCHPDLIKLFTRVIETRDCTILEGHRGLEEQNEAYRRGYSKLRYPHSLHNRLPSRAVDVLPYHELEPHLRYDDMDGNLMFVGYVYAMADQLGIRIRNGADWDMDYNIEDESFVDIAHWELLDEN